MILAIIGAGRIGLAVKQLLQDDFEIKICDTRVAADTAGISGIDWIDASDTKMLGQYLDYSDVVLSAVNYKFSRDILQLALKKGKHYIDLTEDVETTKWIQEFTMQEQSVSVIPQCGLAPGAINIIGGHLARQFEKPVSLKLRVGALPLYSANRMSYYLSWNTAGLLNEYVNLCDAIVDRINTNTTTIIICC